MHHAGLASFAVAFVVMFGSSSVTARPSLAIVNLLRESVAGSQDFHAKQSWKFDPEVASRRRLESEKINGYRSLRLIEKLGLGEDGRQEERLQQQRIRDRGVPISGPIYDYTSGINISGNKK